MNPTRRDFLLTAGSAGAIYVSLPLLAQADGTLAPPAAALDLRYGLPSSSRLQELRCAECDHVIGDVLLDELDAAAPVVCDQCHRKAIADAEDTQDRDDVLEELDKEELALQLDEEREAHEKLKGRYDATVRAFERVRWRLRDIETELMRTQPATARSAERVRELLEGAVLPVTA